MKPLDPGVESLVRAWIEKAQADLEAAEQLAPHVASNIRRREIVGFHCQQAAEKYLKALLTYYQIEFPKTHQIQHLLTLVSGANRDVAEALSGTVWLTPYSADTRYPGNSAEMLPGDEVKGIEIARFTKEVVLQVLNW